MNAKELQKRIIEEPMPHVSGVAVFVLWCVLNGHADPRYADAPVLDELWAKFSMEATDGVRAQVEVRVGRGITMQDADRLRYENERMRDEIEHLRMMRAAPPIMHSSKAPPRW